MKILAATLVAGAALVAAATAAAPVTLTLAASSKAVKYGSALMLTGALSTQKTNQQITIQATDCGTPKPRQVARVKTVANGAYSTPDTPAVGTVYQASDKAVKSNTVAVTVAPVVQLTRVARGSYAAAVTAGIDLKGKTVLFQRYSKLKKRWVQVRRVVLSMSAPAVKKPTVISTATFKSKLPKRTRVRLALSKKQAAPCYALAVSNVVRS
jgi:hypothetical protein